MYNHVNFPCSTKNFPCPRQQSNTTDVQRSRGLSAKTGPTKSYQLYTDLLKTALVEDTFKGIAALDRIARDDERRCQFPA